MSNCGEGIFHEVRPHVFFLWELHYRIPMGYDPMNQTTFIGKFPIGSNPPKIICYSFESKRISLFFTLKHNMKQIKQLTSAPEMIVIKQDTSNCCPCNRRHSYNHVQTSELALQSKFLNLIQATI